MASPSTVLTLGYGTFGDVNLVPTLGYGSLVTVDPPGEALTAFDCGRFLGAGGGRQYLDALDDCGRFLMAGRCSWAGTLCLKVGEVRLLGIDFAEMEEVEGGATLTGTPTVEMVDAGSGVTITGAAVSGTKGQATFNGTAGVVATADQIANGGNGWTDYEFKVTVTTSGSATLSRSGTLRVEE